MSNQPKLVFPVEQKHFIGLERETMENIGFFPSRMIVPAWFGLKVQLDTVPESCMVDVSGRSQFKLFINGKSVLFGPCRSDKEFAYYDTIDFALYLQPGENQILVQVFSYPENPDDRVQCGPNYCYGDNDGPAIMMDGFLGNIDLGDAGNWKVWLDPGVQFGNEGVFLTGSTERIDERVSSGNPFWKKDWENAALLAAVIVQPFTYDPFGCRHGKIFRPRPIALLYRKEKQFPDWEPITIASRQTGEFVLDAGELTTAYFRIGFQNGRGAKVQITYAESYYHQNEDGTLYKAVRDDTTGIIDGMYDVLILAGDTVYESFRFRTFRFVKITYQTADESLTILPETYIETAYPIENTRRPKFTDSAQEKLYDIAFRTLQLCMHDTYEDCPYYEQLQYACDTRLEMLFTYASTDETRMQVQTIRMFAASLQSNGFIQARFPSREDQIIPMFALYFPMMLEDYLNATGDAATIAPFIPIAERIAETFLSKRCPDGLLAPQGYWDYFDWTKEWNDVNSMPTALKDGESALENLFFVYAVQSLCRILPHFHRESLAAYYLDECERLLQLVEKICYVPEKGLYKEGPMTEEYTQHSQIYAVLTGLVKGDKARKIMEKVLDDMSLVQCSFVQKFYLFEALEKVGLSNRTKKIWKVWQEFVDLHCTTFPETPFDPRSDCHGWSALPLWAFSEYRKK